MWRRQSFSEIQDSDQSISDVDEEEDRNWPDNCVSLAGTWDQNKGKLGVMSQLELLKGFCQNAVHFVTRSTQKDLGFSSEDEVELPDFQKSNLDCKINAGCGSTSSKADDTTLHPDRCISGVKKGRTMLSKSTTGRNNVSEMLDLYTKGKKKQIEVWTSGVDTEASRLDQLSENARWSACCPLVSKDKNNIKGGRSERKRTSSSQMQQPKQGAFRSVWKDKDPNSFSDDELLNEAEAGEYWPMDNINSAVHVNCDGETSKSSVVLPMKAALQHDLCINSMADLLDNRRGKIRNLHLKSEKGGRRKGQGQHAVVKNMSLSGMDIMSDEDPCEILHNGSSSTDSEDNVQVSEHAVVESERKTMADKFQEAFGCSSVDDRRPLFTVPKKSNTGLFGRLQHMILQQKEQDADFLKKVQTEVWPKDEARCIDVKLLSRSFDAKLNVCRCSLLENEESSLQNPQQENFGNVWNVIFNPRVCVDVDLEVGNLIRIHPPWKEIQILWGGEIVILAIYFSQIQT